MQRSFWMWTILILTLVAVSSALPALAEEVTMKRLIEETIDFDRLGRVPSPEYHTYQFSSYDRRANLPNGPNWFGNSDGFGREPIPGVLRTIKKADKKGVGTYVLAEMDGPGAIVRCWTASGNRRGPGIHGQIRMYLDGQTDPVFDGPANDFLIDLWASLAKQHKLNSEGLTAGFTQRDACYCPITFNRNCRIEWTGNLNSVHFYHIEMRKYAEGTIVETFHPVQFDPLRELIKHVGAILADSARLPAPAGKIFPLTANLKPSRKKEVLKLEDRGGKIRELQLKLKAEDMNQALRQTVLEIYFDRASRPQVESPLGDFFAAAPGINPYKSLPMVVEPDGTMTCRFVMPFAQAAEIRVINRGKQPVELTGQAVVDQYKWDPKKDLHFYAHWRVNHEMQVPGRRGFDIPFAMLRGEGRFVGCSVHLMNPSPITVGNWWGEGDEKIFVDDDGRRPSFFGTGSEDYFNYSWSMPNLFEYAYFAQPRCDGPLCRGFVANNRFHILDDIPFYKRLDFFMEMIHHNVVDGLSFARISYFYARPGLVTDQMPLFAEDLRTPKSPANWVPKPHPERQPGVVFLQTEDMEGAKPWIESNPQWACGKAVAWKPKAEGDKLTLTFDAAKEGTYRMWLVVCRRANSGKFDVLVNGKRVRQTIDAFAPYRVILWADSLGGNIKLQKGPNTLTFVSRGKDPKSSGTVVTTDFIWFQPQ
ncbi:MAG: DUF2961 domain-containing protein [Pirellulales bacterium]|nr:DUF2961 domain-containing protein [Pirellulales bacterium]